jgi:hypothetical protein
VTKYVANFDVEFEAEEGMDLALMAYANLEDIGSSITLNNIEKVSDESQRVPQSSDQQPRA